MYKLAKNVHKEKGLLYKKLSILLFFILYRWEILCLWQAGKVILSNINLIGLTDSFELLLSAKL